VLVGLCCRNKRLATNRTPPTELHRYSGNVEWGVEEKYIAK
jgi:hypothetical protein